MPAQPCCRQEPGQHSRELPFCTSSPLLPLRVCALCCCEVQHAVLCSSLQQCQPWGAGVPSLPGMSWAEQKAVAASNRELRACAQAGQGRQSPSPLHA